MEIVKMASMSTYSVVVDRNGASYVWGAGGSKGYNDMLLCFRAVFIIMWLCYSGGSAGSMQGMRTDIEPQLLEALPSPSTVKDVSCGLGHALFLLDSGRIYSWGNGSNGRLGVGDTTDRSV